MAEPRRTMPPNADRELMLNNPYYNSPGSREAYEQFGIPPVIVQSGPYATAGYMAQPDGGVVPLTGYPSVYPHVLNGVPQDGAAPYLMGGSNFAAGGTYGYDPRATFAQAQELVRQVMGGGAPPSGMVQGDSGVPTPVAGDAGVMADLGSGVFYQDPLYDASTSGEIPPAMVPSMPGYLPPMETSQGPSVPVGALPPGRGMPMRAPGTDPVMAPPMGVAGLAEAAPVPVLPPGRGMPMRAPGAGAPASLAEVAAPSYVWDPTMPEGYALPPDTTGMGAGYQWSPAIPEGAMLPPELAGPGYQWSLPESYVPAPEMDLRFTQAVTPYNPAGVAPATAEQNLAGLSNWDKQDWNNFLETGVYRSAYYNSPQEQAAAQGLVIPPELVPDASSMDLRQRPGQQDVQVFNDPRLPWQTRVRAREGYVRRLLAQGIPLEADDAAQAPDIQTLDMQVLNNIYSDEAAPWSVRVAAREASLRAANAGRGMAAMDAAESQGAPGIIAPTALTPQSLILR